MFIKAMQTYYQTLIQDSIDFDLNKLKRRADAKVQEKAMSILRSHLQSELQSTFGDSVSSEEVDCFLYLVIRISVPKLI